MKNLNIWGFYFLSILSISCNKDSAIDYKGGSSLAIVDPVIQVINPEIKFIPLTPTYELKFNVINSEVLTVNKLKIFITYTDANTGQTTKPALFKTLDIEGTDKQELAPVFTFAELKNVINKDGNLLPEDDRALVIGSYWTFSFVGLSKIKEIEFKENVKALVKSQFEGKYRVIESYYYRLGSFVKSWNDEVREVETINDSILSYNNYFGPFESDGNRLRINFDNRNYQINKIYIENPNLDIPSTFGCSNTNEVFIEHDCSEYSSLELHPSTRKHKIKMAYGYITMGSGPRTFYEVLEKIE